MTAADSVAEARKLLANFYLNDPKFAEAVEALIRAIIAEPTRQASANPAAGTLPRCARCGVELGLTTAAHVCSAPSDSGSASPSAVPSPVVSKTEIAGDVAEGRAMPTDEELGRVYSGAVANTPIGAVPHHVALRAVAEHVIKLERERGRNAKREERPWCDTPDCCEAEHPHRVSEHAAQAGRQDEDGAASPAAIEEAMAGHVSHDEAEDIAQRYIDGWFENKGKPRPLHCIPANPKTDSDIRLHAYIRQQRAKDARLQESEARARAAEGERDALISERDAWLQSSGAALLERTCERDALAEKVRAWEPIIRKLGLLKEPDAHEEKKALLSPRADETERKDG